MQHFSHPHKLYAASHMHNDNLACFGCKIPLFGTCYACTACKFYLHKFCFDLPQSAHLDSHPKHALSLLEPPYAQGICDECGESCNGFIYNCARCDYDVHANCATLLHSEPKNDRNQYIATFFGQKLSENKKMRSELDASSASGSVTLEPHYDEEAARIIQMKREEELRVMRKILEMQRLQNTYDSIDLMGRIK